MIDDDPIIDGATPDFGRPADDRLADDHPLDDSSQLELRVLHGPQAGSTLPMEEGRSYTIGTSDDCAILLAGTQVEAEHAVLIADATGVRVTALEGKVFGMDRKEIAPERYVALGSVLRLGRVRLTVDTADAPWPQEDALEEVEAVPQLAAVPQDDAAPADAPLAAAAPGDPLQQPLSLPVSQQQSGPQTQPSSKGRRAGRSGPHRVSRRSIVPQVLLGSAAMLMVGAALAAWVTSDSSGAVSHAMAAAQLRAPDAARDEAQAPAVAASARLQAAPQPRVLSQADRAAAALDFVESHYVAGETELKVQQRSDGAVRITGVAATPEAVERITDAARRQLAAAGTIEFAILSRSQVEPLFEEKLRASGLASKFKVLQREPELELQAALTGAEVHQWESLFADFTRDWGSVLTIRARVQAEHETIDIPVETVVAGAFPYVVTVGGQRVAPGGVLEGRKLVAIRDGELVFADGMRMRYAN